MLFCVIPSIAQLVRSLLIRNIFSKVSFWHTQRWSPVAVVHTKNCIRLFNKNILIEAAEKKWNHTKFEI